MKDFISKCKQYKSWDEFIQWLFDSELYKTIRPLMDFAIHNKATLEKALSRLPFEMFIGIALRFFDERGIIINTYIGFNTCWFHSFSPTNHIKDGHKDRQSALKEGIIKSFSILEKNNDN